MRTEAVKQALRTAGQRFVVVYSTNMEAGGTAPHVRAPATSGPYRG